MEDGVCDAIGTSIEQTYRSILKHMDESDANETNVKPTTAFEDPPPTPEPFPDMTHLRAELRRITAENYETKEAERDRRMFESMSRLFEIIANEHTWNTMYEAAENGYDQAILYRFPHQGTWEEYPVLFLLKGPMVDRGHGCFETFFHRKGGKSLLEQLQDVFRPFHVKHRFNRLRQENMIIVSWMVPDSSKNAKRN